MIYLDYAATTPLHEEVLEGYYKVLKQYYGNSDSLHEIGRKADRLMKQSRMQVASSLCVKETEIFFTSCASESNNMAIKGYAFANAHKGKHLITTAVEHSSVLETMKQLEEVFGFSITYLPVSKDGVVRLSDLAAAVREDTILVSCMYINNETGAINPIKELAAYVHTHSKAVFHCDCVQALGKYELPLQDVDMATMSAHKIYGLKGCGLLYKREHLPIIALISAGQQEQHLRGGTSNAPAYTMWAKTIRLALDHQQEHYAYVKTLHEMLYKAFSNMEGFVINSPQNGSVYILNVSCEQIGSEIMLNALNARGFAVSAQSTCASKGKPHSYVLAAMGLGELRATHAIRISLSHLTTIAEIEQFLQVIKEIYHEYRT